MEESEKQAEELRQDHLEQILEQAKLRNDVDAIKAIKRIIHRERKKKMWGTARQVHGKPRGKSVLQVQATDSDGNVFTYDTQSGIEQQAAAELNPCFRLSVTAPIFTCPPFWSMLEPWVKSLQ
jgi:hypothetical protein